MIDRLVSIPADVLKQVYYDETSPSCLRWAVSKPKSKKKAGSVAGTINTHGYWKVCVNYKIYAAHRLVWALHNKHNATIIDHINQKKDDNRINNLRVSTYRENALNSSRVQNAKRIQLRSNGKYRVRVQINQQEYSKTFTKYADAKKYLESIE